MTEQLASSTPNLVSPPEGAALASLPDQHAEDLEPLTQAPTIDLLSESPHITALHKLGSFVTRQVIRAQLLGFDIVDAFSKTVTHVKGRAHKRWEYSDASCTRRGS